MSNVPSATFILADAGNRHMVKRVGASAPPLWFPIPTALVTLLVLHVVLSGYQWYKLPGYLVILVVMVLSLIAYLAYSIAVIRQICRYLNIGFFSVKQK